MSERRTVKDGECIPGIAASQGLLPETIWQHPQNEGLRDRKRTPETLLDGVDEVYIPDIRVKEVRVPVNRRTVFRRKGIPEVLRVRFSDADCKPREGLKYLFEIGQEKRDGKTGEHGLVEQPVPPGATRATLTLRNERGEYEVYHLHVSHLDPATELCGAQQRLVSLGYDCADEYGRFGPRTEEAILEFQKRHALKETGEPDPATLARIEQEYGS